jgi:hypothetical protein
VGGIDRIPLTLLKNSDQVDGIFVGFLRLNHIKLLLGSLSEFIVRAQDLQQSLTNVL